MTGGIMETSRASGGAGSHEHEFKVTTAKKAKITYVKGAKKGKEKQRLSLSDDDVYAIASKKLASGQRTLRNPLRKMRYVTIKDGDQKVEVNIRSAAKRLGISNKEVRGLKSVKDLENKVKLRKNAIERYEAIVKSYALDRSGLTTRKSNHKTGIKPKTVLKVIQKGLDISNDDIVIKPREITAQNRTFVVSKGGEISHLNRGLGSGSFGTVFQTFNFNQAKMEAMKGAFQYNPSTFELNLDAIPQLENEYNVHVHLRDNNTSAELEGIQACPREVTVISDGLEKAAFYQTDLASGDLTTRNKAMLRFYIIELREQLNLCGQLLTGLDHAHTHGKGVVHGDIKPENCLLVLGDNNLPKMFVIADWGGAGIGKNGTSRTSSYVPSDYYDNENRDMEDGKQSDVFATSKTIIETLLGKPIKLKNKKIKGDHYPIPIGPKDKEIAKKIKKDLKKKEYLKTLPMF